MVRGSAEDGYERLPSYLEQIKAANPGSITAIELDSLNRFKYLFLAFGASIRGFKYQRRVIVVDGTHLSGKYGGTMLVAAAQDGNFQIYPLAFGIVDGENDESWEWFFTKLASCVSDEYPLVIVSDRHASIINACAAYAHTLYDFDRYMDEIRSANPDLADYLEEADVTLWSRVHCQGDRYNLKTSNIAESINSALKRARGFPIQFLLEFIREKLGRWYWKRRGDALSLTTQHSRGVEHLLAVREENAYTLRVQQIDGWKFFVKGGNRDSSSTSKSEAVGTCLSNIRRLGSSLGKSVTGLTRQSSLEELGSVVRLGSLASFRPAFAPFTLSLCNFEFTVFKNY
ncbi:PREDICTED: uncharacterized protein LOC106338890 [Brassica oleracea var. oleracea]|uniref:uncharacterized protein LOC106338890 n=1 Tax=Brassica oleracea var. oleracea TaxID=109376 RepID=UPI0006A6C82A|nr:PREDICTED: uncharacterized protein LOC106338890 [Brassica oleracea var. oleracea]